jgi:hypothetical protein
MSIYSTYRIADAIYNFSEIVHNLTTIAAPKKYFDALFRVASDLMSFHTIGMYYYMPEITQAIVQRLNNSRNQIEDALTSNKITSEEHTDYMLMIDDYIESLSEIGLPEKSFFFAYKDGEYYSIMINEDGELIEEYKYNQKSEDQTVYQSLKAWMNQYAIGIDTIEYCAAIDTFDDTNWIYDTVYGDSHIDEPEHAVPLHVV